MAMHDGWSYVQTRIYMDTLVTIEAPNPGECDRAAELVERAFGWFAEVERVCNRFDAASELRCLCQTTGRPVTVTPLLFRAIEMAIAVAQDSGGAFDPTVGAAMEARGFNRNYLTGALVTSGVATGMVSYRNVALDPVIGAVTLRRAAPAGPRRRRQRPRHRPGRRGASATRQLCHQRRRRPAGARPKRRRRAMAGGNQAPAAPGPADRRDLPD